MTEIKILQFLLTFVCSLVLKLVGRIDLSLRLFDDEISELGLSLWVGCDDDDDELLLSRPAESPAAALMSELELDEDDEHTEEPITPCSELTELSLLFACIPILVLDCARLRSMRIFLQMSLSAFAIARAGTSHLKHLTIS